MGGILLSFTVKPSTKLNANQVLTGSFRNAILVNVDGTKQKLSTSDFTIIPHHGAIMVSKDDGDSWEILRYEDVGTNGSSGFVTAGYF